MFLNGPGLQFTVMHDPSDGYAVLGCGATQNAGANSASGAGGR